MRLETYTIERELADLKSGPVVSFQLGFDPDTRGFNIHAFAYGLVGSGNDIQEAVNNLIRVVHIRITTLEREINEAKQKRG